MDAKEAGSEFLTKVCDYLVSLPFDLKILQEAVTDPDLEKGAREVAAGVLLHALNHHEGTGPEGYLEDVLLLRVALHRIATEGGDGAPAFRARFGEVYDTLEDDLQLFARALKPELWSWLQSRIDTFGRLTVKGKRAILYVEDESTWDELYDDGLTFQTNYSITESQVRNKLRRPEQIAELLQKKRL